MDYLLVTIGVIIYFIPGVVITELLLESSDSLIDKSSLNSRFAIGLIVLLWPLAIILILVATICHVVISLFTNKK